MGKVLKAENKQEDASAVGYFGAGLVYGATLGSSKHPQPQNTGWGVEIGLVCGSPSVTVCGMGPTGVCVGSRKGQIDRRKRLKSLWVSMLPSPFLHLHCFVPKGL